MIMRHARYAPPLSNYSGAAGGRTFPSAAGFHTSEVFFTDDEGVYLFETRDAPALVEQTTDGPPDLEAILQAHRGRIRRSEEHTSELQSRQYLVCRLLLEKNKQHIEQLAT